MNKRRFLFFLLICIVSVLITGSLYYSLRTQEEAPEKKYREACGPGQTPIYEGGEFSGCADVSQKIAPSKVSDVIVQKIDEIRSAFGSGSKDVSSLPDDILRIKPDGQIELSFHASSQVGVKEEEDLKRLGGTIVGKLADFGVIQVWIPYDRVNEAANLTWVVAVTPSDYGETD